MNRSRARAGSAGFAFAVALALAWSSIAPALAQTAFAPDYWFAGTHLSFDRPQFRSGALAVAGDDAGLGRFLGKLNATLSYQPGQSYVVITSGDRRSIAFTIGDVHYDVAGVIRTATFAPYVSGGAVYLPFADLARALDVVPVDDDGSAIVLQPQIASLDVRPQGRATIVTLRGASTLHFKRLSADGDDRLSLAFTGIASTLERDRELAGPALLGVTITVRGTPRNPTTEVDFRTAPSGTVALVPSDSANAISVAFAPSGVALGGTPIPAAGDATVATVPLDAAPATPPPPPVPAGMPQTEATPTALSLPPAGVNDLHLIPIDEGLDVALGITGSVTYEWHRLTDNRWYVDLKPATLAMDAQTVPVQNDAVTSLRIKGFVGPTDHLPTVRVALTLATPRIVSLVPTDTGLTIHVDRLDDLEPQKVGLGELTGGKLVASIVPLPQVAATPPPDATPLTGGGSASSGAPPGWKFAPAPPAGVNARLIVIDPGHGGSDRGAMHNDLVEATLNLDISKRLRALLVARGWIVKLTRETDVDVYAPNDSAHDELQARCDVANNAGARLFISVHTNSFTTGVLNGTTTYYYKSDSYGLADAVHARLAANLPTQDDGIRKENFYVIHHTNAPAILVETAFLSNPGDARYLKSSAFIQSVATSIADGVGDYASPPADGN
jgi:N-acetylmuramoyl-L-alanine amidase